VTHLLDTHVFLWMLTTPQRLGEAALAVIERADSVLALSAASAWEIAIKSGLGRLSLPEPATTYVPASMRRSAVTPLPVTVEHALGVATLPRHHGDPFDRLLVSQAQVDGLTLITADPQLTAYDVPLLLVER